MSSDSRLSRTAPRPLVGGGFRLGVFDTSVLTSDIIAALTRGKPSSLLAGMRYGTLRGFIPHYVWAEVPRVLADRKREGGKFDLEAAERLWWQEYVPLLYAVSVDGLPMPPEARVLAREDPSDVGAVQLSVLLAPVVLFASDPDLLRTGVAHPKWGTVRETLGRIGGAERGMHATTVVTVTAGKGIAGAARLARAHPVMTALAAAAVGAYAYRNRARRPSGGQGRAALREVGMNLFTAFAEPFIHHELHQRAWTAAERGAPGPDLLSQVARLLACSPEPMTRTAILDALPDPPAEPRRREMAGLLRMLHRYPAFHQVAPGRWQIGRAAAGFGAS